MGYEKWLLKCIWWNNFRLDSFEFIFILCLFFYVIGTYIFYIFIIPNMMKIIFVTKNRLFLGIYMV